MPAQQAHRLFNFCPMSNKKYYTLLFSFLLSFSAFCQTSDSIIQNLKKDPKALYFIVMGDWGQNGELLQKPVAHWMGIAARQVDAAFVITTGDNFYCCGVKDVNDSQWQTSFENIYTDSALQITWYPTLGNHDYQGNVQVEIDYSNISNRWQMPARYYNFVKNNALFILLDTNPFISSYHKGYLNETDLVLQDTAAQWHWLDTTLTHRKEKWTFVFGHHPVHSTGHYGDSPDLVQKLKPRLEKHRVQIYFSGHEHDLQHQQPEGSRVHYFVSGGGLEGRANKSPQAMTHFAEATPGFMVVALKRKTLQVYTINAQGKVLYTAIINRAGKLKHSTKNG